MPNPCKHRRAPSLLGPPLAILAVCQLGGCPPPPQGPGGASPQAVVRQYREHLKNQKPELAHELLSTRSRREIPAEAFGRFASRDPGHLDQQLAALTASQAVDLELTATLRTPEGVAVTLVRENDDWRLDGGAVVPSPGFSPRDAVARFLRAIENQDCQALVDCAPPGVLARHQRDRLLKGCRDRIEHLQEIAARIRKSGATPQQVSPERAELTYHPGKNLILTKHDMRWYVEDL